MFGRKRGADRDWDRADAWLGLTSLALVIALAVARSLAGERNTWLAAVALLAFLVHPYLLLRVIRHFRAAPAWWGHVLLTTAAVATLGAFLLPSPKPVSLRVGMFAFVAITQTLAAIVLASTARRHRGLTAWRLNFAALGAALFVLIFAIQVLSANVATYQQFTDQLRLLRYLSLGMFVSYFLGLLPPSRLRRMLQRGVEYRFLRRTNEHTPDERHRLVAIDLAHAATSSTATAATLVVIGSGPARIDGASEMSWRGDGVDTLDGPVGRALAARQGGSGDILDLEPGLQKYAVGAERFLAVPIVGATRVWGALLIMQRRVSLFPKDDLAILERLCRYTAEVFDHAQLIADERAHQQREADARLELILESLQDYAVITIDDGGSITSWNAGAAQVFLYPAPEAIGLPISRLFDDGAPWLAEQLQAARGSEPNIPDTVARRKDDSRLTTSIVIRPLLTRSRRPAGYVIVMRDVSQRRLLEERLRQAQKLEAIGRLAAGVAHDFNNMLTVILGYTANLDDVLAEEHRASLAEIRKAGERAAALTRQLLAFSRQQVLQPRVVALPELVTALVPMLMRLLGEHIQIVDRVDAIVPKILADPTQIEQVIVNLAVNARDAMPTGGRLTIVVRTISLGAADAAALTIRDGAYVLLEVIDTGSGVDLATQTRMFEPFFTTKGVGRGTGLGLAMVYGTVQQMNGAIVVESELGRGTTFRIYMPAYVGE